MRQSLQRFCLLLLCVSNSLFASPTSLLTEGVVGNFYLKLNNNKPQCQLIINVSDGIKKELVLKSQSPCYFFADIEQKKIQTYSYPDANIDTVLLIGGTKLVLGDKQKENRKIPANSYCTQDMQAIIVEYGKIKLTDIDTQAFACAEDRLDEKMYRHMIKQPRDAIEAEAKEQPLSLKVTPELSFLEDLQQKIEAIFK